MRVANALTSPRPPSPRVVLRALGVVVLVAMVRVAAVGPVAPSPMAPGLPLGLGSPMTAAAPDRLTQGLADDLIELRSSTADIAEQLRSFNELYVGKLESRIVSTATSLSGLHSNVDRLLERAHVWDNLQLHVAAWTEQMHSLSSKMDLLSRAQDNISALEARLASLPGLDYRLEAVAARLEDADKRFDQLSRNVDELRLDVRRAAHEQPAVVSQFATRGALASLRVVERKLDRLSQQLGKQRNEVQREAAVPVQAGVRGESDASQGQGQLGPFLKLEGGGRLLVRCHNAPAVLDILKDVSAKVDVLFDHSTGCREDEADVEAEALGAVLDDETENQVTRQRFRRRGRKGRTRKHGGANSTLEAEEMLTITPSAAPLPWTSLSSEAELSTSTPSSAPSSTLPAPGAPADGPSSATAAPDTSDPDNTTTTDPTDVVANLSPEDAPCGEKVAQALAALTQAVKALGALPPVPVAPTSAQATPGGCEDLVGKGRPSGEYVFDGHSVYCDMDTDGGGWTVVQRRGDWGEPREDFNRTWVDYREGFGDPSKEFWIGNKWLHMLTRARNASLRVDLWDWEGEHAVAEYAAFRVAGEDDLFRLTVSGFAGNATDALDAHLNRPFSTWDANHDTAPSCCPCAPAYSAGWWFYSCFEANLNGEYHTHPEENEYYRGIIWEGWRGDYSLRAASMMIRGSARPSL